jgi:hypothetical protein
MQQLGNTVSSDGTEFIDFEAAADFETLLSWTRRAIGTDPDKIHPSQIPSRAAVSILKFANSDPKTFWGWVAKYDQKASHQAAKHRSYPDEKRKHFRLFQLILDDLKAKEKNEGVSAMTRHDNDCDSESADDNP